LSSKNSRINLRTKTFLTFIRKRQKKAIPLERNRNLPFPPDNPEESDVRLKGVLNTPFQIPAADGKGSAILPIEEIFPGHVPVVLEDHTVPEGRSALAGHAPAVPVDHIVPEDRSVLAGHALVVLEDHTVPEGRNVLEDHAPVDALVASLTEAVHRLIA